MKIIRFFIGLLSLTAVACTAMEEPFSPEEEKPSAGRDVVFHAVIDDEHTTKTYIDAGLDIRWNESDRVTVFNDVTRNVEFEFQGEDGDLAGDIRITEEDEAAEGGTGLGGRIFAIYPYSQDTQIGQDGEITYEFPDVQTYREKSFGPGANVMVAEASSTNKLLTFKNAMGYLSFKLWGDDVHVSSVILDANGGEAISGQGTIRVTEGVPVVSMDGSDGSNKIRLYCDDVLLGSSAEDYTEFWFALPPVAFTAAKGGFKITVTTTDGGVFTKSAPMDLAIKRNTVERMAPLKVQPKYQTANKMTISSLSSTRGGRTYQATEADGTFTLTIPTVTDFSQLPVVFTLKTSSDVLMVGGKKISSGEAINASQKPTSLVVCRDNIEKTYKLVARNTGLPVVRITTDGFTLADLESYQNALQSGPDSIDFRVWLPDDNGTIPGSGLAASVSVRIERPDGSPGMENGTVYEAETQIKGRGNYTWKWDKKPYALKLKKKKEILGMPAHKRWVLLANWRDRTLLRNDAAFWLARQLAETGLPYTVSGQFVELEVNGEHRGNYYLCEQIKIDKNRVNIKEFDKDLTDLSGGYLMEIDSYWDEVNKFRSAEFHLKYMFKDPDKDPNATGTDPAYAQGYLWMEDYINRFEKSLKTRSAVERGGDEDFGEYADYLDVDSAISFLLVNELTGNRDFFQGRPNYGPHSTYLYKDKGEGKKLFMGPVWDFDYETFIAQSYMNQFNSSGWRGFDNKGYYYYFMCHDPQFVERIQEIWNSKKAALLGLPAYINTMVEKIGLSQQFDEALWPYATSQENRNDNHDYYDTRTHKVIPFDTAIIRMRDNFTARVDWMDDKINSLTTTNPTFKYE